MMEEISKKKLKKDKRKKISIFKLLYKTILLGGIVLSVIYFTFYVKALPNIKDLSQIINYLIAVFGIFAFYMICFAVLLLLIVGLYIAPFIDTNEIDDEQKNILKKNIIVVTISILLMVVVLTISTNYKLSNEYPILTLAICGVLSFLINLRFCKVPNSNKLWIKLLHDVGLTIIAVFQVYFIYLLACFFNPISGIDLLISIVLLTAVSMLGGAMMIDALSIAKKNFNLQVFKKISYMVLMVFIATVFLSGMTNKNNPMLIRPFAELQIGSYVAEIHFKKDFILNDNPFKLNDNNKTFNTFYVLSSIGDEYIFQEILPGWRCVYKDKNEILVKTNKNIFLYNEENKSSVHIFKKLENNDYNFIDCNETYKCDNTAFDALEIYWNEQLRNPNIVYRIPKDKIEYTVTGDSVKQWRTVW